MSHLLVIHLVLFWVCISAQAKEKVYVFSPGHPSLNEFLLPTLVPQPHDNRLTPARVELGKKLFFDHRLSGDQNMSCASCHNPGLGWSDGLPLARGEKGMVLTRSTPSIFNVAFNPVLMWDGREPTLEVHAMQPIIRQGEMNIDIPTLFRWLNGNEGYKQLFAKAYPREPIDEKTLSKAISSFERTIVSGSSPVDRWIRGEAKALSAQQVAGFRLFAGKANCIACHSGANFTDSSFHNIGLASWGEDKPDLGRFAHKPLQAMRGAFKTPTLREVARTAPYFHDGSANTLMEVVEHYSQGGVTKTNLSADMKPLNLSAKEKMALIAFMEGLSSPVKPVTVPQLPLPGQ